MGTVLAVVSIALVASSVINQFSNTEAAKTYSLTNHANLANDFAEILVTSACVRLHVFSLAEAREKAGLQN